MENKNILVGVTGGVAAYKTCELVRLLVKQNYSVKVIMTENAIKFIAPLAFETLSKSPVYIGPFAQNSDLNHIGLAKWAHALVIAPATANTIAKIANGIADNLLTTVAIALPKITPLFLAPAMNVEMWNNVFNQRNVKNLGLRQNTYLIGPESGPLADGTVATGRMSEPLTILAAMEKVF